MRPTFLRKRWMWIGAIMYWTSIVSGVILLATDRLSGLGVIELFCAGVIGLFITRAHRVAVAEDIRTSILVILHGVPYRTAGMNSQELWEHPNFQPKLDMPALNRALDRMVKDGLVTVMTVGHSRSETSYLLTNKGHEARKAYAAQTS